MSIAQLLCECSCPASLTVVLLHVEERELSVLWVRSTRVIMIAIPSLPIVELQVRDLIKIVLAVNACVFFTKFATTVYRQWQGRGHKVAKSGSTTRPSTPELEKRTPGKFKVTRKPGGKWNLLLPWLIDAVLTVRPVKNGLHQPSNGPRQLHIRTGTCKRRNRFRIGHLDMDRRHPISVLNHE